MESKEAGFGLVEVVCSLGILGMIFIPLMGVSIKSSQKVVRARRKTEAVNLARRELERLRTISFSEITDVSLTEIKDSNYKYQIEVTPISSQLKEVIVTITYKEEVVAQLVTAISTLSGGMK